MKSDLIILDSDDTRPTSPSPPSPPPTVSTPTITPLSPNSILPFPRMTSNKYNTVKKISYIRKPSNSNSSLSSLQTQPTNKPTKLFSKSIKQFEYVDSFSNSTNHSENLESRRGNKLSVDFASDHEEILPDHTIATSPKRTPKRLKPKYTFDDRHDSTKTSTPENPENTSTAVSPARRRLKRKYSTDESAAIEIVSDRDNTDFENFEISSFESTTRRRLKPKYHSEDQPTSTESLQSPQPAQSPTPTPELQQDLSNIQTLLQICSEISTQTTPQSNESKNLAHPKNLNPKLTLKAYQLIGIHWIHSLYKLHYGAILADEMGLGKTIQIISFFVMLKFGVCDSSSADFDDDDNNHAKDGRNDFNGLPTPSPEVSGEGRREGIKGVRSGGGGGGGERKKHLVVVPSSTVDNWLSEFNVWAPRVNVVEYIGSVKERAEIREYLFADQARTLRKGENGGCAEGDDEGVDVVVTTYNIVCGDRKLLKKLRFDCFVLDEGHMMKNKDSNRYKEISLISNVNFKILLTGTPVQNNLIELFSLLKFTIPNLFCKLEFPSTASLIPTFKSLLKPFLLRRKKSCVVPYLPSKTSTLHHILFTDSQRELQSEILQSDENEYKNTIMQLRKCSNHVLLFRRVYGDEVLERIVKVGVVGEGNRREEVEVLKGMSDIEVHMYCSENPKLKEFMLTIDTILESGKIQKVVEILKECKRKDEKVLIFSQFIGVLDILEHVLYHLDYSYLRMDGQTPVAERHQLTTQFATSPTFVFLLSTKSSGLGLNLTCANVVIIHDPDFNPHNDAQAEDRVHRVGQTREVRIERLVAEGVEEWITGVQDRKMKLDLEIRKDGSDGECEDEDDERVVDQVNESLREYIKTAREGFFKDE